MSELRPGIVLDVKWNDVPLSKDGALLQASRQDGTPSQKWAMVPADF